MPKPIKIKSRTMQKQLKYLLPLPNEASKNQKTYLVLITTKLISIKENKKAVS